MVGPGVIRDDPLPLSSLLLRAVTPLPLLVVVSVSWSVYTIPCTGAGLCFQFQFSVSWYSILAKAGSTFLDWTRRHAFFLLYLFDLASLIKQIAIFGENNSAQIFIGLA